MKNGFFLPGIVLGERLFAGLVLGSVCGHADVVSSVPFPPNLLLTPSHTACRVAPRST